MRREVGLQSHKYFYFGADIPVMDDATREQFKWKFYKLATLLNGIVLMVAIGIVAFFKAPGPLAVPLAVVFLVLAAAFPSISQELQGDQEVAR